MESVIQVSGVSKRYGRQLALDNVNLTVPRGVVFALLGENGAGKTTLIRSLLGLLETDAGELTVLGRQSRRDGLEIRRRVGYVPERPTLYDWMTVSEIGWFTAAFYAPGFIERYNKLAAGFGLPADRKLKALSKGMRAKVALSLALAHEPDLLILDEPTSGLDTLVRRQFLESMVDIAAAGRTVLLSSHQISEVERVADVVAILRKGRLILVEPLDELKAHVRDVTIHLDADAGAPAIDATIIHQQRRARQWRIIARGIDEGQIESLRARAGVADVEIHRPSLEDIYLAYMQSDGADASPNRQMEVALP